MTVVGEAVLSTLIDGDEVAVTVTESWPDTAAPVGGVPDTVAVFTIDPASTLA